MARVEGSYYHASGKEEDVLIGQGSYLDFPDFTQGEVFVFCTKDQGTLIISNPTSDLRLERKRADKSEEERIDNLLPSGFHFQEGENIWVIDMKSKAYLSVSHKVENEDKVIRRFQKNKTED